MIKIYFFSMLFLFFASVYGYGQAEISLPASNPKDNAKNGNELGGSVLDSAGQKPLPYASILVLHKNKGTISNEQGDFTLNVSDLEKDDTLCFLYIGYKPEKVLLGRLETTSIIYLKEEIYNLNETFVFGNPPDPKFIVKQVIKNKETNYQPTTCARQSFIRQRYITDFESFRLNYKKSTIPELNEETLKQFEENMPKYTTSYTDFLGNLYFTKNEEDSARLKVEPIRTVQLKEKEFDDLEKFDTLFEHLFATTGEKEYWKIKSGILGEKIEKPVENTDTVKEKVNENERKLKYFGRNIESRLKYSLLDDKDQWEFLYETGRYDYTLTSGTSFNGEDVYIIDFVPDKSGLYTGRLYISVETYALIRADYTYAPGKTGRDIQLLGVGYTENQFSGSIYFEQKNHNYTVKFFSQKTAVKASIDRNVEISKKQKRALFDKELMDFDIGLEITLNMESLVEFYVLDDREISEEEFAEFKQLEYYEIIFVDQFDDKLWSGYSIIEPTQKMKDYKKQAF